MSTVADGLPDILPDLRRWAHKLTAGHHDALDLVQDTCERALRHAESFQPGSNLRTWCFQIMRHQYIDRGRRRQVARAYAADYRDRAPVHAGGGQEAAVMLHECLSAAAANRACDLRLIVAAAAGHTNGEMAAALGLHISTVKTRLMRGRRALRKAMRPRALLDQGAA